MALCLRRSCQVVFSPVFPARGIISPSSFVGRGRSYVVLSPGEVTSILQSNEHTEEVNFNSIKSFDTNQLPSNNPVEDARTEGRALYTTGVIFGVFDGHGGPSCAQVVAKRLVNYISASLLPPNLLPSLVASTDISLLQVYNDNFELVEDLSNLYSKSFKRFLQTLQQNSSEEFHMSDALIKSFLALDSDITEEAKLEKLDTGMKVAKPGELQKKTLSIAVSGAVGCVAHIDQEHLHVASCGDCRAVLGSFDSEHQTWTAQTISQDHNSDNPKEVDRILKEHPDNERDLIIRNDRMFGQLVPLRAFGDVRFKWSIGDVKSYLVPLLGEQVVIKDSQTPPYLTAKPDVFYHKLRGSDKFLILATDGLWDLLSPSQAVRLVGEHTLGKVTLQPFNLPQKGTVGLANLHKTLSTRQNASKLKPIDANAATHLIRHALGGTDQGMDHGKLSQLLTYPDDSVRLFRDDITATIIFFDSEYLIHRPL